MADETPKADEATSLYVSDAVTPRPPVAEAPKVEAAPVPKMTRPEFIARLDQLVAEGEVAGLPTAQIIASRFAREGTRRITSMVDDFLDGLAGSS